MIQASIACGNEQDDPAMMRRVFDEISNPQRVAAMREAIDAFDRHGFPWKDRYIATMQPGHRVEVTMAGMTAEHFMARTGAEILIGKTADLPDPHPERDEAVTFVASDNRWEQQTPLQQRQDRQQREQPEQER
jgi:cell filamentation protein